VTASASVETAAPMKTSTSMEASTEARLPARRKASRDSSMIKAAECTGMRAWLGVWRRESMLRRTETSPAGSPAAMKSPAMKSAGVIEVVAIDEDSAVGDVGVVVVNDSVVMPIISPVVPSPAKPAKEADSEAEAKRNPRTGKEQSWIRIPAWPDPDGLSIGEPRVVLRHVNNLRVGGFDHNCLFLLGHLFLRCVL